jgi:hypothetical protein
MAEQAVEEKLARLAAGSPIVLEQIKQSLHRSASLTMAQALEVEAISQAACSATDDCAEEPCAHSAESENHSSRAVSRPFKNLPNRLRWKWQRYPNDRPLDDLFS